jgi:hypothetical protein
MFHKLGQIILQVIGEGTKKYRCHPESRALVMRLLFSI